MGSNHAVSSTVKLWLQRPSGAVVGRLEVEGEAPSTVEHLGLTWTLSQRLPSLSAVIYVPERPARKGYR